MSASAADAEHERLADADYARELEQAVAQSLKEHRGRTSADQYLGNDDPPPYEPGPAGAAGDFARRQAEKSATKTYQERAEEEIVLEYIKKQSLLEAEHKRQAGEVRGAVESSGQGPAGTTHAQDDEDLQRALDLSLTESAPQK